MACSAEVIILLSFSVSSRSASLCLSYLVMPYMFTDLSKVRGHLSEDKVQFLVYQMLCGLRVSISESFYHEVS